MKRVRVLADATLWLALIVAAAGFASAQTPERPGQPELSQEAQTQLIERLLDHATAELNLNVEQRGRLQEVLEETLERRSGLVRRQRQLGREIQGALSDPRTDEEEFRRLAEAKLDVARQGVELAEWQQERLAEFLTARQLLRFMNMQDRLAQRIQEMRRNRRQN